MGEVKCPMGYKNPNCNNCPDGFGKEGFCDWPYRNDLPTKPWMQINKILAESEEEDGI